jgi:hypothetical protein
MLNSYSNEAASAQGPDIDEGPPPDLAEGLHRDVDGDGLGIEYDAVHVHVNMFFSYAPATNHPGLLITPAVARAIAQELLSAADAIDPAKDEP